MSVGFLDQFGAAMKSGFDKESERLDERRQHSHYRTVVDEDRDLQNRLDSQSDASLLNRARTASGREKTMIESLLRNRGYTQRWDGGWSR